MTNTLATVTGHDIDCMCVPCMMADMDSHIVATGGQSALDRINMQMDAINGGKVDPERTRFARPGQKCGNGVVRKISTKQANFIKALINRKDSTGIKIYPGQTLDVTKVHTMGLPAAKALIGKLLSCPDKPSQSVRMATPGQVRFMNSLNSQITTPEWELTEADINSITFAEVNETLDCLKSIIADEKKIAAQTPKVVGTKPEVVSEGMYKVEECIFKVQTAKTSGRLYAKELIDGSFEYAQGAMRIIKAEHRMTLDEAKAYGKATGTCCNCGRELTNPESIEAGIGPICAARF